MTSTKMYQGMDTDSKPSSRVLAPPGGGSSNIFGATEPVAAPAKREPVAQKPSAPQPAPQPAPLPQGQGERGVRQAPKQAFNPITGEPIGPPPKKDEDDKAKKEDESSGKASDVNLGKENEKAPVKTAEKPSTCIAQPPGGKSSGPLW